MQNNSFTFTKEAIDKITPPAFTRDNKGKVIRPEIVQHVYIFKIIKYFLQYPNYSLLFPRFNFFIRPLSKLAYAEGFEGDAERRTAAYSNVREDSSTASTYKSPAEVEFRKRSIKQRSI